MDVAARLKASGFDGLIAATASHPDEVEELQRVGVDVALDFYGEAGSGFADHVADSARERGIF